jgi:hypothetical protein
MQLFYPKIRLYHHSLTYHTPHRVFIAFEFMDAALGIPNIQNVPALPLNDYLGLYRMALLFTSIPPALAFGALV